MWDEGYVGSLYANAIFFSARRIHSVQVTAYIMLSTDPVSHPAITEEDVCSASGDVSTSQEYVQSPNPSECLYCLGSVAFSSPIFGISMTSKAESRSVVHSSKKEDVELPAGVSGAAAAAKCAITTATTLTIDPWKVEVVLAELRLSVATVGVAQSDWGAGV
ncbi:hypothetical protein C5167_024919 [Papaver somniferum]|uniref:Uncharacterized protein n=1 Tax=Papaver somniferum TaxID=3469 RepID=A0A4Y7JU06_PAPSO|nr:hypothetical protein C5167_024919 [Papaver somniferum]